MKSLTAIERKSVYKKAAKTRMTQYEGTYYNVPPEITEHAKTLKERRKVFPELNLFDYDEKKERFSGLDGLIEERNIEVMALLFCAEMCNDLAVKRVGDKKPISSGGISL